MLFADKVAFLFVEQFMLCGCVGRRFPFGGKHFPKESVGLKRVTAPRSRRYFFAMP